MKKNFKLVRMVSGNTFHFMRYFTGNLGLIRSKNQMKTAVFKNSRLVP